MKKTLLIVSIGMVVFLSGCANESLSTSNDDVADPVGQIAEEVVGSVVDETEMPVDETEMPVDETEMPVDETEMPVVDETDNIEVSQKVEYIEFEAVVVTEANFKQFGGKLDDVVLSPESTQILLTMNNHRDNLSEFDYRDMANLDGQTPQEWQLLSVLMGGHHASGILTFAKNENPKNLTIEGLPVGDVVLDFNAPSI